MCQQLLEPPLKLRCYSISSQITTDSLMTYWFYIYGAASQLCHWWVSYWFLISIILVKQKRKCLTNIRKRNHIHLRSHCSGTNKPSFWFNLAGTNKQWQLICKLTVLREYGWDVLSHILTEYFSIIKYVEIAWDY